MFDKIEKDLFKFQKPARYIGNEPGIPEKDFTGSFVKFAICYPDIYEIGMSNYGIKLIYDRINKLDFAACERVFFPATTAGFAAALVVVVCAFTPVWGAFTVSLAILFIPLVLSYNQFEF